MRCMIEILHVCENSDKQKKKWRSQAQTGIENVMNLYLKVTTKGVQKNLNDLETTRKHLKWAPCD